MKRTFIILLMLGLPLSAAGWQDEYWQVENFTRALGGGPETGPAQQAGATAFSICGDAAGNRYLVNDQFIDIVTSNNRRYHLAGTGYPGLQDGPAQRAEFNIGAGGYRNAHNIVCTGNGELFVTDNGNRRIRHIYKQQGQWQVKTWVGGGSRILQPGDSDHPKDVRLPTAMAIAVTSDRSLYIGSDSGALRVSPKGDKITHLGPWPESSRTTKKNKQVLHLVMGDNDQQGNVYFLSRTPDVILRINPDGKLEHIAGITTHRKLHDIGDTSPREAYFDTPSGIAAAPDGNAVFIAGGDEYSIRRIPTDGITTTATLMQNGHWGLAQVHPNRSQGAAFFMQGAQGQLKPRGNLTDLMAGHLLGRDYSGTLYTYLYHWRGSTQYIQNQGLLGTGIFGIRRIKE